MVRVVSDLYFATSLNTAHNLVLDHKISIPIIATYIIAIIPMITTIKKYYESDILKKHEDKRIILLTAHRRENIGEPMHNIFKAIKEVVDNNEDVAVIYPMHKNPKVREIVDLYLSNNE